MPNSPYTQFIESIPLPAALTTYDANNPIVLSTNKLHQKLTGFTLEECKGQSPRIFKGKLTDPNQSAELKAAINAHEFYSGQIVNYRKDQSAYNMILTVFGVIVDGQRYYVGVKRWLAEIN